MQEVRKIVKILIVDDEEGVRISLKKVLERDGYEVLLADRGAEGIEIVRKFPEDIETVISDFKMPGMDGIELVRRIREFDTGVPVILCTAYGEYRQNLETWASDDYIVKSANLEGLFEKVAYLLARRASC